MPVRFRFPALVLCLVSLAGYAFAKYRFRHRDLLFAVLIATMFLPPIVTLIPLYRLTGAAMAVAGIFFTANAALS